MTPFTVHPEGVEILKDFGLAALTLACVALRFSSLPGDLFVALIERVTRDFEPPSTQSSGIPDKRALQKENRQVREQVRRAFREKNQRMRRAQSHRRLVAFDCFAGIIVAYLLTDWLLIPEPYKMPQEQRWPIALTVFLAGALVIFVGTQVWDERVGWKKWTFWMSVFAASIGMLGITRFLPPHDPWGMIFDVILGGVFFLWVFGRLRRIDQNQVEQERLAANLARSGSDDEA